MTTFTVIAGYWLIAVLVATVASITGVYANIWPATSRRCARTALLAFAWPALVLYWAARWVRYMWGLAEWRTR
ncbi:hypothetical protein [Kocuria sp.]|uniref:hypothetical protein n=1 Tax=Kocuria sp. TaxID=1871328 RepID=UPI0026DD6AFE|nr:hypothetical protein [Kocuria sp.]MDO4919929.1 hypothetical protein [Kocuria sp.]